MYSNSNRASDKIHTDNNNFTMDNNKLINVILKNLAAMQLENIHIKIIEGVVVISGIVSSFYEKEKAFNIVCHVAGVTKVANKLCVDLDN